MPDYDPKRLLIESAVNDRLVALLAVLILSENAFGHVPLIDQFSYNDFSLGVFKQVMKSFIGVLFTPMFDGRYFTGDKLGADRWCEFFDIRPSARPQKSSVCQRLPALESRTDAPTIASSIAS